MCCLRRRIICPPQVACLAAGARWEDDLGLWAVGEKPAHHHRQDLERRRDYWAIDLLDRDGSRLRQLVAMASTA